MEKSRLKKTFLIFVAVTIGFIALFKILMPRNIMNLLNIDEKNIAAFIDLISHKEIKLSELFPRYIKYTGSGTVYDIWIRYSESSSEQNINITSDGNIYYRYFKFSFVNYDSSNEVLKSINEMISLWQNDNPSIA